MSDQVDLAGLTSRPWYRELDSEARLGVLDQWENDFYDGVVANKDWSLQDQTRHEIEVIQARREAAGLDPGEPEEIAKTLAEAQERDNRYETVMDVFENLEGLRERKKALEVERDAMLGDDTGYDRQIAVIDDKIAETKVGIRRRKDVSWNDLELAEQARDVLQGKQDATYLKGRVIVNPDLYYDKEQFVEAVNKLPVSSKPKAEAIASWARGREALASEQIPILEETETFQKWVEGFSQENPDATKGEVLSAFYSTPQGSAEKKKLAAKRGGRAWLDTLGVLVKGTGDLISGFGQMAQSPFVPGQNAFSSTLEAVGGQVEDAGFDILSRNAAEKNVLAEKAEALGGFSATDSLIETGVALVPDIGLTLASSGTLAGTRALVSSSIKKQALKEASKKGISEFGKQMIRKKATSKLSKTEYLDALNTTLASFAIPAASSGGSSYYDAYLAHRDRLAAQGMVGEELEAEAREQASVAALRTGVITGAITRVFGLSGVEGVARLGSAATNTASRKALKKGILGYAKRVGLGALGEGFEEALDEGLNGGLNAILQRPDMTFNEWAEQTLFAGVAGTVLGGAVEIPVGAFESFADRTNRAVENSPEMAARRQKVQELRDAGLNQTADALERDNAREIEAAGNRVLDAVEERTMLLIDELDRLEDYIENASPEIDTTAWERRRDEIAEQLNATVTPGTEPDLAATGNRAVAELVSEGLDVSEARAKVVETVNEMGTSAANAVSVEQLVEAARDREVTTENTSNTVTAPALVTTDTEIEPVTPTKAEPTFRAVEGRPVLVDGQEGDVTIEEDGTVLLDRGAGAPPIILGKDPNQKLSDSEFEVSLDEGTEQERAQASELVSTIAGRELDKPVPSRSVSPRKAFVRKDGAIVTNRFADAPGDKRSTVSDFVSSDFSGDTPKMNLRDRATGEEFQIEGDDAIAVGLDLRAREGAEIAIEYPRFEEISDIPEVRQEVQDGVDRFNRQQEYEASQYERDTRIFEKALTRHLENKTNLLKVTTDENVEATPEELSAAVDELSTLREQIYNETKNPNVRRRVDELLDEVLADIARVERRSTQAATKRATETSTATRSGTEESGAGNAPVTSKVPALQKALDNQSRLITNLQNLGARVEVVADVAAAEKLLGRKLKRNNKTGRGFTTRIDGQPVIVLLEDRVAKNPKGVEFLLVHEAIHASHSLLRSQDPNFDQKALTEILKNRKLSKKMVSLYPGYRDLSPEGKLAEIVVKLGEGKLTIDETPEGLRGFIERLLEFLRGNNLIASSPELEALTNKVLSQLNEDSDTQRTTESDTRSDGTQRSSFSEPGSVSFGSGPIQAADGAGGAVVVPVPTETFRLSDASGEVRSVSLPVTYLRAGDIPTDAEGNVVGSFAGGPAIDLPEGLSDEGGVSVYSAYKDPATGKYIVAEGGESFLSGVGSTLGERPVFEVTGSPIDRTGADDETLLSVDSIKRVSDEVIPKSNIVLESQWVDPDGPATLSVPKWVGDNLETVQVASTFLDIAGDEHPISESPRLPDPQENETPTDPEPEPGVTEYTMGDIRIRHRIGSLDDQNNQPSIVLVGDPEVVRDRLQSSFRLLYRDPEGIYVKRVTSSILKSGDIRVVVRLANGDRFAIELQRGDGLNGPSFHATGIFDPQQILDVTQPLSRIPDLGNQGTPLDASPTVAAPLTARDEAYLSAVEKGNLETAAKILEASPTRLNYKPDDEWSNVTSALLERARLRHPSIPVRIDRNIPVPARTVGRQLVFNPDMLAEMTAGMYPKDAAHAIETIFVHEQIHLGAVKEIGEAEVIAHANQMTLDERLDVARNYLHRSAYASDREYQIAVNDFAGNDPRLTPAQRQTRLYRLGHEALRMTYERLRTGHTTEETLGFLSMNPGVFARATRYLKAVLNRLKEWWRVRRDPALHSFMDRLSKALWVMENRRLHVDRGEVPFNPRESATRPNTVFNSLLGREVEIATAPTQTQVPIGVSENPDGSITAHRFVHGSTNTSIAQLGDPNFSVNAEGLGYGTYFGAPGAFPAYGQDGRNYEVNVTLRNPYRNSPSHTDPRKNDKDIFNKVTKGVAKDFGLTPQQLEEYRSFFPATINPITVPGDFRYRTENAIKSGSDKLASKLAPFMDEWRSSNTNKVKFLEQWTGHDGVYAEATRVVVAWKPEQVTMLDQTPLDASPWGRQQRVPLYNNAKKAGSYNPGGWFTAAFKWDRRLFKELEKARGRANAAMKRAEFFHKEVRDLLKKHFGKEEDWPMALVNEALGNTDNRLTAADEQQIRQIKKDGLSRAKSRYLQSRQRATGLDTRAKNTGNRAFADQAAKLREDAKEQFDIDVRAYKQRAEAFEKQARARIRQQARIRQDDILNNQIPQDLADVLRDMRQHIDLLSRELRRDGLISDELKATIDENEGLWLHRSYKIFDQDNYVDWLLSEDAEASKIRNDALNYIRSELVAEEQARIVAAGTAVGPAALAQAQAAVTPDMVRDKFHDYLSVADFGVKNILQGATVSKETNALLKRGTVPPEIRRLWGEYEDPTINAAKSLGAVTQFVATQKFFQEIRDLGIQEGWLSETSQYDAQGNRLVPILANNGMTGRFNNTPDVRYTPLAGLYGPPMLRDALALSMSDQSRPAWLKFFQGLTGYSMATKTVLSWQSAWRNFWGNIVPTVANGNLGWDSPWRIKTAIVEDFVSLAKKGPRAVRERIIRLTELNVIGESVTESLINDLTRGFASEKKAVKFIEKMMEKTMLSRLVGKGFESATRFYGSQDDFWKIVNFENEVKRVRKFRPGATQAEVEAEAAEIVRATMPTYSQAPELVRAIRLMPFLAPYITFPAEVYRTTAGILRTGVGHVAEGLKTGNENMVYAGIARLGGFALATGGLYGIVAFARSQSGWGEEDEEDLRQQLPYWETNSTFVMMGKQDNGDIDYFNLSYMNPYDVWSRPLRAFIRGYRDPDSGVVDTITETLSELIDPIAKEQILFGSLVDIARGVEKSGASVYDNTDPTLRKAWLSLKHVYESALEPGTAASIRRIRAGWRGEVSQAGRSYDFANEFVSAAFGIKKSSTNAESNLSWGARSFKFDQRQAASEFTRVFKSPGTQSNAEILDAYVRANDKMKDAYLKIRRKAIAAIRLGTMTKAEVVRELKDSKLGDDAIADIFSNRYRRYMPTKETYTIAAQNGSDLGQDRIALFREALELVPAVQQLSQDDNF